MNAPELDGIVWRTSSYSANGDACVEVGWRKSSYSANGSACVEVGWHKSSHSAGNDACVEVAVVLADVLVRDSKQSDSPILAFAPGPWRAFLHGGWTAR